MISAAVVLPCGVSTAGHAAGELGPDCARDTAAGELGPDCACDTAAGELGPDCACDTGGRGRLCWDPIALVAHTRRLLVQYNSWY